MTARVLLFLTNPPPPPPPPPLAPPSRPPALSVEFYCYSGSLFSYSGASTRSCVSNSAQRGRPVDPLRVLSVVASLRRIDPMVLVEVTRVLFHTNTEKKRKGVWIEINSDGDDDQSERSNDVASEGSTITAVASAGSMATSGRYRWAPWVGCATGGKGPRRAKVIRRWFSQTQAGPATENDIRVIVDDNSGTSKAI
jgi:hypothetical protein